MSLGPLPSISPNPDSVPPPPIPTLSDFEKSNCGNDGLNIDDLLGLNSSSSSVGRVEGVTDNEMKW
jgi:hypothetical protein